MTFDNSSLSLKVSSRYEFPDHRWFNEVDPDILALTSNQLSTLNFELTPRQAQGVQFHGKVVNAIRVPEGFNQDQENELPPYLAWACATLRSRIQYKAKRLRRHLRKTCLTC